MIRDFDLKDIDYITEKMKYFHVSYNKDNICNHPFNKYLIYEENDKVMAFLEYALYYDRIELNYIYVNSECRQKGIGTKLLTYLINMYKNVLNITLEVSEKNEMAIKLYEKCGFKKICIRYNYYPNGENAIMMMRGL